MIAQFLFICVILKRADERNKQYLILFLSPCLCGNAFTLLHSSENKKDLKLEV